MAQVNQPPSVTSQIAEAIWKAIDPKRPFEKLSKGEVKGILSVAEVNDQKTQDTVFKFLNPKKGSMNLFPHQSADARYFLALAALQPQKNPQVFLTVSQALAPKDSFLTPEAKQAEGLKVLLGLSASDQASQALAALKAGKSGSATQPLNTLLQGVAGMIVQCIESQDFSKRQNLGCPQE